jgi:hypothetical protein
VRNASEEKTPRATVFLSLGYDILRLYGTNSAVGVALFDIGVRLLVKEIRDGVTGY